MKFRGTWIAALAIALAILAATIAPSNGAEAAPPWLPSPTVKTLTSNADTTVSYGSYLNGQSFQQDGITTFNGWQYAAFWDSAGHVNLGRRELPSGAWQVISFADYTSTSTDAHNTISIGISSDGRIHLAFDMHVQALEYRMSTAGMATRPDTAVWNVSQFGAVSHTLGSLNLGSSLTYPVFLTTPTGTLQFAIRSGGSGNGDQYLYEYSSGAWASVGRYFNGTSSSVNAYFFGFEYDRNGRLHTTWALRDSNESTNHGLYYAYSDDAGRTWKNNGGTTIGQSGSSPITPTSSGTLVGSIGINRGYINQESQAVDSAGIVHVITSALPSAAADDSNFARARTTAVITHWWRDLQGVWHQDETGFKEGESRADIVTDSDGDIYVAFNSTINNKLTVVSASAASNWSSWTQRYQSSGIYFSNVLLDHERSDGVVTAFMPRLGSGVIDTLDFGQPNVARYSIPSASSSYETAAFSGAFAHDGVTSSAGPKAIGWASSSSLTANHSEYLYFNFGAIATVKEVDIYPRTDGGNAGYGFPVDFKIEVSSNGSQWTTVVSRTNYPLPTNGVQVFSFTAVSAQYVRITGTSLRANANDNGNYRMVFAEVEVY